MTVQHPCTGELVKGKVVGENQYNNHTFPRVELPDGRHVTAFPDHAGPLGWKCADKATPLGFKKTPGEYLVEAYPDDFAERDPASLDASIRRKLLDPNERPKMLSVLRRDIKKLSDQRDDAVLLDTIGRIDARYGPPARR